MAAGARIMRSIAPRLGFVPPPPYRAAATSKVSTLKADDCSGFLPWLRRKAGTDISSVLCVGSSSFGRSLFASQLIQEGDCIMKVPYNVQLTQDKLPEEVHLLLDDVAGDTTKIAVLLMMEQHLGHESGWAPYVRSLPCKDQMHNMMFWDLNELCMVKNSSICDETVEQKEQARKEFSAVKPALERFPHLFGEIKLEDFMHASALVSSRAWKTSRGVSLIPFADFLNHDGVSDSILLYDEQKDVSEVIADRNYAVGEQVMIRYGKYSNATLALNFGFTLSRNIYDQAHILIDMPEQDPLYKKKLDIWQKHRTPKSEHMCSSGCTKTSFAINLGANVSNSEIGIRDIFSDSTENAEVYANAPTMYSISNGNREVKYSGGKGIGIPQILRAFFRVFYATSIEELEEMATDAAENDGRLARRPLKNVEREIHTHRKLLLHLDDMIQGHSTAIEQLEIVDSAASRSVHPFRKEMANDILAGELQVLQSAHAWVANYCETVNMS